MSGDRQAAVLQLFAAASNCPKREKYPSYAEYAQAFEAYQAETMEPLRQTIRDAQGYQ